MAVFSREGTVDLNMDQFANDLVEKADLEQQEEENASLTDRLYQRHPPMEPDIEEQIISGFKGRNVKKLRDLLLPASMKICRNCNSCHSLQKVDWRKVMNDLRSSRGSDRVNILNTFKSLVRDLPEVANKVLSGCVTRKELDSGKFKMVYEVDYLFLEEYGGQQQDSDDEFEHEDDIEAFPQEQNYTDSLVVQYKVKRAKLSHNLSSLELISKSDLLLVHPVVMSYLREKWKKYLAICYFLNLGLYLLFLGCLTTFSLTIYTPLDPICNRTITNGTNIDDAVECDISAGRQTTVTVLGLCTIIFSFIRLTMEICEFINLGILVPNCRKVNRRGGRLKAKIYRKCINWNYLKKPENYFEIPVYILSICFSFSFSNECLCPTYGLWQVGIIVILLAWVNLLHFFNKWPLLGKYIAMFQAILVRFVKVLIIAIVLLVAFSLAFYMALHEPDLPDTPFDTPLIAMAETISQVIGSPDFSIFRLVNDDTMRRQVPFRTLSILIWIVFGVCVSVLFITFLTALAVYDVNELKLYGKRKRTELMIALFVQVEKMKKICLLFGCCNRRKEQGDDFQDAAKVDTTMRNGELSQVTVRIHSTIETLGYVVGVDSINALIADFEEHSIRFEESVL